MNNKAETCIRKPPLEEHQPSANTRGLGQYFYEPRESANVLQERVGLERHVMPSILRRDRLRLHAARAETVATKQLRP